MLPGFDNIEENVSCVDLKYLRWITSSLKRRSIIERIISLYEIAKGISYTGILFLFAI